MVKQGASHRSSSHSSKHQPHISSFSELSLLDPHKAPPVSGVMKPHLPSVQILPEPSISGDGSSHIPDHVYLHAAAIFQNNHLEKAATHRVISYGKNNGVNVPDAKSEASQQMAYELAFNTLKYQELLEDLLIDSCFCLSQPMPEDLMSLVAVMLYDFQDRKFLPREGLANQTEKEAEPAVRQVEKCLLKFKTKLAASLARCRIKHDLLTIDCILPDSVREKQERASNLPLYAWVNTLKTSMEEVFEMLKSVGFSEVNSMGQLEGKTFCLDTHCLDLLVFPASLRGELYKLNLLSDHRLVIQDKSACIGPWALLSLLDKEGDVLMAGSFSSSTIAHTAAIVASKSTQTQVLAPTFPKPSKNPRSSVRFVFVCVEDRSNAEKEELQEALSSMGCSNVKLLSEAFHTLDKSDSQLNKVLLIMLTPQCSLSAVSNPVDYLLKENGDTELLQDLSRGSVSPSRLDTLISQQKRDLQHALQFPKVQAVVYSTCSSFSEENEEVVEKALSPREQDGSKPQPFRLQCAMLENVEDKGRKADFFRLEPSDKSNGCFLAVLTRQPEPEVTETPQEVLARAAATGLLDGILPDQPIRKERRGQKTRKGASGQGRLSHTRSQASVSSQSRLEEFLRCETKASSSAPRVAQEKGDGEGSPRGRSKPTPQLSKSFSLKLGSASSPALTSSPSSKSQTQPPFNATSTQIRRAPVSVAPPPAPPKGRHEVLRPMAVMFPPVLFPDPPFTRSNYRPPPLRINPTMAYLQWRSPSTAALLPHTRSSSSFTHPRPWL
ncbi:putative methyltransferase NSUN7 [Hoplias malabaricus]|uniref:putative methyltransferase NSUN7 n=1 Tax=Hoplias malabaricus TaxID=27720 RepID=UPI003461F9D1